jgi:hypothetical protein
MSPPREGHLSRTGHIRGLEASGLRMGARRCFTRVIAALYLELNLDLIVILPCEMPFRHFSLN